MAVGVTTGDALAARIDVLIARIDGALSRQLNAIRRHPEFRALEARWRGLHLLTERAAGPASVIVRLLDADWRTIARDQSRAVDFDRSRLFALIHDGEFGMPGGLPFGLLICDEPLGPGVPDPQVAATLRGIAGTAAAAFCPFVARADPSALELSGWDELTADAVPPVRVGGRAGAAAAWSRLRRDEDTRFVALAGPDLILRGPPDTSRPGPACGFRLREGPQDALTLPAPFALALTIVQAFQDSGWFAGIRGALQDEAGAGRVPDLPPLRLQGGDAGLPEQPPVLRRLSPDWEDAAGERGVVPVGALYLDPGPVIGITPTLHEPGPQGSPVADQNARLAAMLHYVLCTSRFAHYLKVIMRDEIGRIAAPGEIRRVLGDWLSAYCIGNDDASAELKARYPLRDAGVEVHAIPGKPGSYACTIRLQPHFQLDDVTTSFHLVAEAQAPADPERRVA